MPIFVRKGIFFRGKVKDLRQLLDHLSRQPGTVLQFVKQQLH